MQLALFGELLVAQNSSGNTPWSFREEGGQVDGPIAFEAAVIFARLAVLLAVVLAAVLSDHFTR